MVITMSLKRVILRGKTYYFRMLVPKDCIEAIGKTEIVISLKTKDPLATKTKTEATVARLEAFWTAQFNEARGSKSHVTAKHSSSVVPDEDSESFRQGLIDQMAFVHGLTLASILKISGREPSQTSGLTFISRGLRRVRRRWQKDYFGFRI